MAKTHYATYHENVALKIREELSKTGILLTNVFYKKKNRDNLSVLTDRKGMVDQMSHSNWCLCYIALQ